jgi:hypothetical protein
MLFKTIKRQIKKYLGSQINLGVIIHLRKYIDMVEINWNATLGRHFLTHPRHEITIETSGFCNLSCKFCAYSKKELAKVVMPMSLFQEVVNQAVDIGFSCISLTPMTGDVFMDKGIFEKMQYLDNHPKIKGYSFFTNFVVPSEQKIEALFQLRKLNSLRVSVYGHDKQSFCDLTGATKKEYQRLVKNLKYLYELYYQNRPFELQLKQRTLPSAYGKFLPQSELQELMLKFEHSYGIRCGDYYRLIYGTWGGKVTDDDVNSVGLTVNDGSSVYKKGLCNRVFKVAGVLADGRVDLCFCRDAKGSLVVGDVKKEPLSYLLSLNNPLYANIIQEQMENKFRSVCKSCDWYHSIYKPEVRWGKIKTYSLNQVKALLN